MARLAPLLARLQQRLGEPEIEAPDQEQGCALPLGHRCTRGWHWRGDGGAGTAYTRCPRTLALRREQAAAEMPGEETFESFESIREPDAFQACRLWAALSCTGVAKLALLRPQGIAENTGCGKTHLLRAAARELTRAGRWVELLSAWDLTKVVRGRAMYDSLERSTAEITVKRWTACEVLILDDLGQEETAAPITAGFLVGLLDDRDDKSFASASNLSEPELRNRYGAPLVSRLLGGAHVPALRGRDYRRQRRGDSSE